MAGTTMVVLLGLVLVDLNLLALDLTDDLAFNRHTRDSGRADLDIAFIDDHDGVEGDSRAICLIHLDKITSLTNANASSDFDHDGLIDWHEYLAGTSPTNDQSLLVITSEATAAQGAGILIHWASETGKVYQISRTADLGSGVFQYIATNLPATPSVNIYTDQTATGVGGIYRVEVSY